MTGCSHNRERAIVYPPNHGETRWGRSLRPGDYLLLKCPHGCEALVVGLGKGRHLKKTAELRAEVKEVEGELV